LKYNSPREAALQSLLKGTAMMMTPGFMDNGSVIEREM
jgi:hypothetical protein